MSDDKPTSAAVGATYGLFVGLAVAFFLTLIAIADPGGWEWWRVALIGLAIVVIAPIVGGFLASA